MPIRRFSYLSFLAMVALSLLPERASAQLTCGWCEEWGSVIFNHHRFPNGGDKCGWPPGDGCSRCGRTSSCHRDWWVGDCHIPCGPDGDPLDPEEPKALARAVAEIEDALAARKMDAVAVAISSNASNLTMEYLPDAGRIDVLLSCNPLVPARTLPVPPDVRGDLSAALAARASRSAEAG